LGAGIIKSEVAIGFQFHILSTTFFKTMLSNKIKPAGFQGKNIVLPVCFAKINLLFSTGI
jgi:hypothetical protein